MWVQWAITSVVVLGCLAYAVKTLLPKLTPSAGGCGAGCGGCAHAGGAASAAIAKPCAAGQSTALPLVFHAPISRKS